MSDPTLPDALGFRLQDRCPCCAVGPTEGFGCTAPADLPEAWRDAEPWKDQACWQVDCRCWGGPDKECEDCWLWGK